MLVALFVALPALAADIVGVASVVDGDTIEIHGARIRLHGIDAPESAQRCRRADDTQWPCGREASFALADLIGRRTVKCDQRDTDRYGRVVAVCSVGDIDTGAWLVEHGYALAYRRYSLDYVDEENAARRKKAGMWEGKFVPPWEWRSQ
jgi:endonuclease YncB( thermonuclease family)